MSFPEIVSFAAAEPGPYERQMGRVIAALLRLTASYSPDAESNRHVLELATTPGSWSAAHRSFQELRARLLEASRAQDRPRELQYQFEEACCQAMYNATDPTDAFDPSAPFFVVPLVLALANAAGVSCSAVYAAIESANASAA